MIRDAYVMLVQEPWCYTPDQVAELTDWQIEHLYARPAAERAEELRKSMPDQTEKPLGNRRGGKDPDIGEPGSATHRNWMISAFVNGPLRMKPEAAAARYESQLAQWKAEQGK
jgi:hypothetical protein